MASQGGLKPQPPLVDDILQIGKLAFDPAILPGIRRPFVTKFTSLLDNASTLALLPVLSLLVQPGISHEWLRSELVSALARLPLRHRGVQDTIEFILSIHPSTASSSSSKSGKGAAISEEALNAISKLFSSPPAGMVAGDWFNGIAPQLLSLLRGEGEPDMDKVAAFVIGFGILGRKQYGAPGMPGWKAFVEPLYTHLDPALSSAYNQGHQFNGSGEVVESLRGRRILSTASEITRSLRTLSTLVVSHPHPNLAKRLLRPLLLPLWALSAWPQGNTQTELKYKKPADKLLRVLLQLSSPANGASQDSRLPTSSLVWTISQNITFTGPSTPGKVGWEYVGSENGDIHVEQTSPVWDGKPDNTLDLTTVDIVVGHFISLLQDLPDLDAGASNLFLDLCTRWLSTRPKHSSSSIQTHAEPAMEDGYVKRLIIEGKIMEKMISDLPEKLVTNSQQVLDLVNQVLKDFVQSGESKSASGDPVVVELALSLLHNILMSAAFRETSESTAKLGSIRYSLQAIGGQTLYPDVATTARNLLQLLKYRSSIDSMQPDTSTITSDQHQEDRKSLSLAMSYLTTTDAPPPVRAQGLELIFNLMRSNSPLLDVPALLVLFSSLLQDSEEYIYLRVIKCFIQLSQKNPKTVMKDLVDRYVDSNEEYELDQRLRLGEALLQVIQENAIVFTGEAAQYVCNGLLFVAGRRGHRHKTESRQEKADKLKRHQNNEAEDAWGGPVPQLDELLEADAQGADIISQITSGWESQRGSEDVRVRTSALSVLGPLIELNVEGVGSATTSNAVDLSIHVLTLEGEPEKGILRRAAILLVMSFVRALDAAIADGKKLKFGLAGQSLEDIQRVLGHVQSQDGDGLVRQHARDVLESLRNWQFNTVFAPLQPRESRGIQNLAGLTLSPREERGGKGRPRIEEIE